MSENRRLITKDLYQKPVKGKANKRLLEKVDEAVQKGKYSDGFLLKCIDIRFRKNSPGMSGAQFSK